MPFYRFALGSEEPPADALPEQLSGDAEALAYADEIWSEMNPTKSVLSPRVFAVREDGSRVEP